MDEKFENDMHGDENNQAADSKKETVSVEENTAEADAQNVPETENTDVKEADDNEKKSGKGYNLGKEILEWVYTIAIALLITFLVKGFVFDVVRVDGPSMNPTLVHNDKLIVTKLGYKPQNGDIIILDSTYKDRMEYMESIERTTGKEMSITDKIAFRFNMPSDLKSRYKERYYVKRVIALPGQTVDFDDDGNVLVDGKVIEEEYYSGVTRATDPSVEYPLTVEDNMVFVLGDNRSVSKDSRYSDVGQIPYEAIMGKAQFRIWPFSSFGGLY